MKAVYEFLATQTGTNAPQITVIENTLGGEINWWYGQVGIYYGEFPFEILEPEKVKIIYNGQTFDAEDFTGGSPLARLIYSDTGKKLLLSSARQIEVLEDDVLLNNRFRIEVDIDLSLYNLSAKE